MYFSQGYRQNEIVDRLSAKGYYVSKSSVGRAIKSHSKRLRELKKNQDWAEALISATNNTARLDIADAGLQIAAMKLLEEVSQIDNFETMNPEEKVTLLTKVSRAIGLAANVELNFQRGRKQGIIESKDKFEAAGKELGIPDDKMDAIKAKVFGIDNANRPV
jgi:hypothetical protein